MLNIDIRNQQNLLESLEQYVKGDLLEGANAYHCEKCNKKVLSRFIYNPFTFSCYYYDVAAVGFPAFAFLILMSQCLCFIVWLSRRSLPPNRWTQSRDCASRSFLQHLPFSSRGSTTIGKGLLLLFRVDFIIATVTGVINVISRECAIKFNDYFEFPRQLDMMPYTVQGLAMAEGRSIIIIPCWFVH